MNDFLENSAVTLSEAEIAHLLKALLHKEGSWVDWGKYCQQLQQAGYPSQKIFEETGFQAVQQNLVIVAAQVYESIATGGASPELLAYLCGPKSDVLYEFRTLNQAQRLAAAPLIQSKNLEADSAREVARAIRDFWSLVQLPAGFERNPGDAVAYQSWKRARQTKDLAARSRAIAQGLKFAESATARAEIEKLLSDFTVVPTRPAPLLPLYRLESEENLPRLLPVAGQFPLTKAHFLAVQPLAVQDPFATVSISGTVTLVPVPGWQGILAAGFPVGIFCRSDELPRMDASLAETVLLVVDRQFESWNSSRYYLVEEEGQLTVRWFETEPELELVGEVILVLRPKRILDENNLAEPWQMDD